MAKKQAQARAPQKASVPRKPAAKSNAVDVVFVNPLFKLVLASLLGIFAILLILSIALAYDDTVNERQGDLFTFSSHSCGLILGAIIGLLSGKGIDAFAYSVPAGQGNKHKG